ncbi:MAG: ATP-binding protein [Methanobacteriaceae archaeon]|nr:ATP-binding protein [Methanobacteriaceae archaeon]
MKCYITWCFTGFIALDENCALLDYELFPKSKITLRLTELLEGNLVREEKSLLKRLVKNHDEVVVETEISPSKYESLKDSSKFKFQTPNKAGEYVRTYLADILIQTDFIETEEELKELIHDTSLNITRDRLQEASEAEDLVLIQAINALDELDETTSKLAERLREWYSIHLPELDKIKSHEYYVKLVADYGDRDSIISSGLKESDLKIETSIGSDLDESDIIMLKEFASSIKSLQATKKSLNSYIEDKMDEPAPNLKDLVGASLGAKIIAHVGGLKRLALLSSSTIQVLGAEKALFRHLKTGERPPKHGLIYQHPEVRGAKYWLRGKIARALASKISLAVRKDVFSGEFDPSIKTSFEAKVEDIKKAHPFPKRPGKSIKPGKKVKKKKKREKYKKKFDTYY